MSDYRTILFDRRDAVAQIQFNRPHARNSLTDETSAEFADAVERTSRDASIRVLLIRGNGKDFCPGADVKAYHGDPDVQAGHDDARPEDFRSSILLHEMPAVTVAAIRGGCAGAGFGLVRVRAIFASPTAALVSTRRSSMSGLRATWAFPGRFPD